MGSERGFESQVGLPSHSEQRGAGAAVRDPREALGGMYSEAGACVTQMCFHTHSLLFKVIVFPIQEVEHFAMISTVSMN